MLETIHEWCVCITCFLSKIFGMSYLALADCMVDLVHETCFAKSVLVSPDFFSSMQGTVAFVHQPVSNVAAYFQC